MVLLTPTAEGVLLLLLLPLLLLPTAVAAAGLLVLVVAVSAWSPEIRGGQQGVLGVVALQPVPTPVLVAPVFLLAQAPPLLSPPLPLAPLRSPPPLPQPPLLLLLLPEAVAAAGLLVVVPALPTVSLLVGEE